MKTLNNLLSKQDCMDLAHTTCNSFYDGREDEFEILKNKKVPKNKDSIMLFYDNHLSALLCYNTLNEHNYSSLIWREVRSTIKGKNQKNYTEEWIVITDCYKTKK